MNPPAASPASALAARFARWIGRWPVLAFVLLTFAFSWLLWLVPFALGVTEPVTFRHLNTLGAFGPALAALILTRVLHLAEALPPRPRPLEAFALATAAAGALYFICLPYASSLPVEAGLSGWLVRILLFCAAGLVLAAGLSGPPSWKRLFLSPPGERPRPAWYLAAALAYPLILLAGLGLDALSGQSYRLNLTGQDVPAFLLRAGASFIYILLFGGPLNEEGGWRGFMLPMLQRRINPLLSTLILGGVWGIWHFPMHLNGFYPSGGAAELPAELATRMLTTMLAAVLLTWFYNKTRGSVLVCILLHAGFNTASAFIPTSPLSTGLLVCLAAALIIESRMWKLAAPPSQGGPGSLPTA